VVSGQGSEDRDDPFSEFLFLHTMKRRSEHPKMRSTSKLSLMQRHHSFHLNSLLYRYSLVCFGCFLVHIARVPALVSPGVISTTSFASTSSSSSSSSSTPTPVVLSIAGSDSGGGAGIQADLHAIHSFGCHGCTAITCVTAQNSVGVSAVHEIPPAFLREQLHALDQDFSISSIKVGMVYSSDNAKEIGNFLASYHQNKRQRPWIVCDPVMISTSGSALISAEAKRTMIEEIFPYVDMLTPNKFEAEELLGKTKVQNNTRNEENHLHPCLTACFNIYLQYDYML
jgi:hypothetical protein